MSDTTTIPEQDTLNQNYEALHRAIAMTRIALYREKADPATGPARRKRIQALIEHSNLMEEDLQDRHVMAIDAGLARDPAVQRQLGVIRKATAALEAAATAIADATKRVRQAAETLGLVETSVRTLSRFLV